MIYYKTEWSIFNSIVLFLIISTNVCTSNQVPKTTMVKDNTLPLAIMHGLTKLTDALNSKNISLTVFVSIVQGYFSK